MDHEAVRKDHAKGTTQIMGLQVHQQRSKEASYRSNANSNANQHQSRQINHSNRYSQFELGFQNHVGNTHHGAVQKEVLNKEDHVATCKDQANPKHQNVGFQIHQQR